jgi:hypothetical protein
LIVLSKKIPDTLFIETNYIFKGFNDQLIENLFNTITYRSKFILPCLLEKNKPLPLVKEILKGHSPRQKTLSVLPAPHYQQSIQSLKKEYNQIDSTGFQIIITRLKKNIDHISSHNCTVIFFEMPVDSLFLDSPKMNWERRMLKSTFSDKKFIWAYTDTSSGYITSDGIHLLNQSLEKYIHYFNNSLAYK